MIVRKITPEELKRTNELFAIAFEFETDNSKSAKEVYEEIIAHPKSREDAYWQERWAAFEDDDSTMMSFFVAKPFPVNFDGHSVIMTGIGGVASLPQYRRTGGIRGCFEASLPAMYEEGVAFSYLYPFSTAYYRKFGYELCCETVSHHIRLNAVRHYPVDGCCSLVEPGYYPVEDIKKVYEVWQNKYNMMVMNEAYEYAWIQNCNPAKEQSFTYIYHAADGSPKGYFTFKQVNESDGRNICCSRFFFTDAEGLKGLLNLAVSLGGDHGYITFELPSDADITLLLPEWSMGAGSRNLLLRGMARVVNVTKVLSLANLRGTGSLVIAIQDRCISHNNACFEVLWQDGSVKQAGITGKEPDVSMGINEFSRLITGACDTEALPFMDGVVIHNPAAPLSGIFYKKPIYIAEYF